MMGGAPAVLTEVNAHPRCCSQEGRDSEYSMMSGEAFASIPPSVTAVQTRIDALSKTACSERHRSRGCQIGARR